MLHQTIAQLRELKLMGMADALQRQSEQAASSELAFEQRESHRVLKRLYFLRECSHEQEQ